MAQQAQEWIVEENIGSRNWSEDRSKHEHNAGNEQINDEPEYVLPPLPAKNGMKLRTNRPAVFLSNEMDRESFRDPHRFQHTFLGIDAVFKLDVVVVGGVQGAADPRNDSVPVPHEPGNDVP